MEQYDLKFFADVYCKFNDIQYYVNDNITHNRDACKRDSSDAMMVQRDLLYNNIIITNDNVMDSIMQLVSEHHVWLNWGYNEFNDTVDEKGLLGVILGLIRFQPPKTKHELSNSGKKRWAHSLGSLLNYCGLGNTKSNYNRHIQKTLSELVYSLKERNADIYSHCLEEAYLELENNLKRSREQFANDVQIYALRQGEKKTAELIITHIYNLSTQE